jgi:hypothetical protein
VSVDLIRIVVLVARSRYMGVFANGRMASISQTSANISTVSRQYSLQSRAIDERQHLEKLRLMVERK